MSFATKRWVTIVVLILVPAVCLTAIVRHVRRALRKKPEQVFTGPQYLQNLQDPATFRYSYYLPGRGSKDKVSGFPSDPVTLKGDPLPFPIVVVNNIGCYLIRIGVDGSIDWVLRSERVGHGVGLLAGRLFYSSRTDVVAADPETGRPLSRYPLEESINFVNVSEGNLIVGFSGTGMNKIRIFSPPDGSQPLKLLYSHPQSTSSARHAETKGGVLYVADTFNHRFVAFDMAGGTLLWSREAYFPNDIKVLPNGRLLLVEEHANRIAEVDSQNRSYKVLLSCPDPLYRNPETTVKDFQREELGKAKADAKGKVVGVAAEEHSGPETLYSPNGATPVTDDSFIVADTDNHRVLVIRQGRAVSTLRGFTDPVKIGLLQK